MVLAIWQHECHDDGTSTTIETFRDGRHRDLTHGNRERVENLIHARDHCNGLFRVVKVVAKDRNAPKRKMVDCWPEPGLVMKLTYLDDKTGAFRAKSVRR